MLNKLLVMLLATFIVGCATIPEDAFRLSETSLQDRKVQSRVFETADEVALLAAGIAVFQDLGYSVDETEKNIGIVTASKTVDATDGTQVAAAIVIALLGGGSTPIDKEQKIKVSFVTKPSKMQSTGYLARVTFQRIIWNTHNQISRAETLKQNDLYVEFFDKLSKAVFLEGHSI
ncbi:hypothetical protein OAF58_00770 [bacterium]|nr:hypothetical protein [bacterium]